MNLGKAIIAYCLFFTPLLSVSQYTDNGKREGYMADPAISPVYAPYEWPNEIPEDCPSERSKDIGKVVFTGRYANYTGADTWYLQSGGDGNMYSCWTDGDIDGFSTNSNIRSKSTGQAKITGSVPLNLKFENLGRMWSGGTDYYPCVSLIVDDVFYIGTYNAFSQEGYFNGFRYSYNWDHFTANTEPDWKNEYWTNAIDTVDANFFDEVGKARFRTPHAVNFAENNKAPDGKVYLSAHGHSSGSGKNDWDKGDAIYLCRVNAAPKDIIDPGSYEFFGGKDARGDDIWKKGVGNARPILDWPDHLGSEGITWFPKLGKYILMSCRLKENEDNLGYNVTTFWESDNITGPYKIVHYMRDWGQQAYFPNIPSQLINEDGNSAWMTVACNYSAQDIDPHQCRYAASMHEIVFDVPGGKIPVTEKQGVNIAPQATVSATSEDGEGKAAGAIDGVVDLDGKNLRHEWVSQEGGGAIIKLEWDSPVTIDKIRIFDSPDPGRWTKEGYLVFSDGSMEWMYAAPSNSAKAPTEISFGPRTVKWVKFTITKGVSETISGSTIEPGKRLGVSEIQVFEALEFKDR